VGKKGTINMHNTLKKATMIFCGCLLILMLITPICQGKPVTFVDDVGKEITVHEPARRIISLYSAHTENLFALGLDQEIIGVGRVDIYPPKALEKQKYDWKSDPEKVIAAEPDVVIIRPFIKRSRPEFVETLEKAGVRVVALYPDSFEEFDAYIRKLALLTGKVEWAEELLRNFHQKIHETQNFTKAITPKVHVYFESVENGYKTVTSDSMPARAIEVAGGVNIAQDARPITQGSSIAAYNIERILEQADKIDVYISQQGAMHAGGSIHSISIRPGFYAINAVRNKRIYVINEKLISSPTFRYITGIQEFSRMFYPEIVDDLSRFNSEEEITREKIAEIAVRFKHKPIFVPTSQYYRKKHKDHTYGAFKDVEIQSPYFDFIETAVISGYMEGYKEHKNELFYPEKKLTRDEFARIIFMLGDLENTPNQVEIKDIDAVSNSRIVQFIVNKHIMDCKDGYFRPNEIIMERDVVETLEKLKAFTK
jgi:iron complex transport system substrate-binding protein